MRKNTIVPPKNKKGEWCYTLTKTSARRRAKRIHKKRMRRWLKENLY